MLAQVGNTLQIMEKWRRDAALQRFDPNMVLCISWGTSFVLNHWLILCMWICLYLVPTLGNVKFAVDHQEACQLWCQGVRQLCQEQHQVPHALLMERWLRKQVFFHFLPNKAVNFLSSIHYCHIQQQPHALL